MSTGWLVLSFSLFRYIQSFLSSAETQIAVLKSYLPTNTVHNSDVKPRQLNSPGTPPGTLSFTPPGTPPGTPLGALPGIRSVILPSTPPVIPPGTPPGD